VKSAIIAALVVTLAAAGITGYLLWFNGSGHTVLPSTGLHSLRGVAVDTVGTVYITDNTNSRVLKLPAGSNTPVELPFTGLNGPEGVAVDTAGNVYVTDYGNNRVLKLPGH
jgi:serine/threonine protein kinase, bacterial